MPAQHVTRPVRTGLMPPLADCYTPRPETGHGLASNLIPGDVVVLAAADSVGPHAATAPGGMGKTQLAAGLAHTLWETRAVDLLVWVTASSRDAIMTGFTHALDEVGAGTTGEDPAAGAARFADWLSTTSRPWLLVLDDLADPADLEGLWPDGSSGRVLVTSRRNDPALHQKDRRVVEVGALTRREALSYLSAKFNNDPGQRIGAVDLAEELGCVPIALAQAAALIADRGANCREYRLWFAERGRHVTPAGADQCSAVVAVTWSLCVDRADQLSPAGMAWPALVLAALLDAEGVPGAVLTSAAASGFVVGEHAAGTTAGESLVRSAVANLARLGLATVDPTSTARTVRVHAVVQAAVRKYLLAADLERAASAAADAMLQAWPAADDDPLLAQALRDCTARLREVAGDSLWNPEAHPVLFRAGESLDNSRLRSSAVVYWQAMVDTGNRILGAGHQQTFHSRGSLARAHESAGQFDDAIPRYERTLVEREWLLGADHPDTLAARNDLASAYRTAGRLDDAIPLYERTLNDREQILGPDHQDTLASRADLAAAYRTAGRHNNAIDQYRRTLKDRERIQGPDHPDTLTARGNLAYAYRVAGRLKDAIPLYKKTLAHRERIQGPDHPDTLTARGNLAFAYQSARRPREAIPLYERTLADWERIQGRDHPDTLTARGNLAYAYQSARRIADAIRLYERTLADCERVLGPDHPDTLTSRGNLGHAYYTAGWMADAIEVFRRTLADCDRVLGPDHPLSRTVRENLDAATRV